MVGGFKECFFLNINYSQDFITDSMYPQLDSGLVFDFFLDVFGNRLLSLLLNSLVVEKQGGTGRKYPPKLLDA